MSSKRHRQRRGSLLQPLPVAVEVETVEPWRWNRRQGRRRRWTPCPEAVVAAVIAFEAVGGSARGRRR